eukprot:7922595-Prorocentrum_lima.AAC.1
MLHQGTGGTAGLDQVCERSGGGKYSRISIDDVEGPVVGGDELFALLVNMITTLEKRHSQFSHR